MKLKSDAKFEVKTGLLFQEILKILCKVYNA